MKVSPRSLGSLFFFPARFLGKLLSAGREQHASYALPGVIRGCSQVSYSSLGEDRPRGHGQQGLGLLLKKAMSYSLREGFPLPGWKGWFEGVRQPVPAQPPACCQGACSAGWKSAPRATRWCREELFPWVTKCHRVEVLPSCQLAASSGGLSFVQGWTGTFPYP